MLLLYIFYDINSTIYDVFRNVDRLAVLVLRWNYFV